MSRTIEEMSLTSKTTLIKEEGTRIALNDA